MGIARVREGGGGGFGSRIRNDTGDSMTHEPLPSTPPQHPPPSRIQPPLTSLPLSLIYAQTTNRVNIVKKEKRKNEDNHL